MSKIEANKTRSNQVKENPNNIRLWQIIFVLMTVILVITASAKADSNATSRYKANVGAFEKELTWLRYQLNIPGAAFIILKDGKRIGKHIAGSAFVSELKPLTDSTPMPLQSITKNFVTVVVMQMVEEGKLALLAPVKNYLPKIELSANILLEHLLTHTSEGIVGEEYVYGTGRFALLEEIIKSVDGHSLKEELIQRVFKPAKMNWIKSPHLAAHYGLVSNLQEMEKYLIALENGVLLNPTSMQRLMMRTTSRRGGRLPTSLGWFAQSMQGESITWAYGQGGASSALLLRIPDRKLSLFVIASSEHLSNPFRLMMGDVKTSLVANSFLRLFVFSKPGIPLESFNSISMEKGDSSKLPLWPRNSKVSGEYIYADELLSLALIDLYRKDIISVELKLKVLIEHAYSRMDKNPMLPVLAVRVTDKNLKKRAIVVGENILTEHPNNRWFLGTQAVLMLQTGQIESAESLLKRHINLPNQNNDFVHRILLSESLLLLAEIKMQSNPKQARDYLNQVVEIGFKGTVEIASKLLKQLK